MAWTDPRTWVTAETVTAALLNTHVRDNLKAFSDARTDTYDPALSATSINVTYTLQEGMTITVGKLIVCQVNLKVNTVTNAGTGDYSISLPSDARVPASGLAHIGNGMVYDVSATTRYLMTVERTAASSVKLGRDGVSGFWGAGAPFTLATGDEVHLSLVYEAA